MADEHLASSYHRPELPSSPIQGVGGAESDAVPFSRCQVVRHTFSATWRPGKALVSISVLPQTVKRYYYWGWWWL